MYVCVQLCPTLCDHVDCNPPVSSVHGISQARILEWVIISFSSVSSQPGTKPESPASAGRFLTTEQTEKPPNFVCARSSLDWGMI